MASKLGHARVLPNKKDGRLKPRVRGCLLAGAIGCLLLLAGCGNSGRPVSSIQAELSGPANIAAAASLSAAFDQEKANFQRLHPKVRLQMIYAGSQALSYQIQSTAPVDVFASADTALMQQLVPGWVTPGSPRAFAGNLLEIVVPPGNPRGIHALADLVKQGVTLVLCAPSVPAGMYGNQALAAAGLTPHPASLALSVTNALTAVQTGNADASIVYVTDVLAGGHSVSGVPIPDAQNVLATYPIAALRTAQHPAIAKAFVDYILSPPGQATLKRFGFLPPPA